MEWFSGTGQLSQYGIRFSGTVQWDGSVGRFSCRRFSGTESVGRFSGTVQCRDGSVGHYMSEFIDSSAFPLVSGQNSFWGTDPTWPGARPGSAPGPPLGFIHLHCNRIEFSAVFRFGPAPPCGPPISERNGPPAPGPARNSRPPIHHQIPRIVQRRLCQESRSMSRKSRVQTTGVIKTR